MQDSLKIETLQHIDTEAVNQTEQAAEELLLPADLEKIQEEPEEKNDKEDIKRAEHEAAEAKRKEEWEAKQQAEKDAEQEQLDKLKAMDNDEVMAAALFYQYLSEKDSEFLINNNYTKEEVLSGFKQLLVQSGYNNLLYIIKDDE